MADKADAAFENERARFEASLTAATSRDPLLKQRIRDYDRSLGHTFADDEEVVATGARRQPITCRKNNRKGEE